MLEPVAPESSEVFETTNGEKIRIEFDRVYVYKSANKASTTVVELGWSPDTETVMLDISFDDFDAKYQANKKAMKEYYASLNNHHRY